jgi:hypothetical protein
MVEFVGMKNPVRGDSIDWNSDGSPVSGAPDAPWKENSEYWKSKAEALQSVVDAAVAGVDSFNSRGLLRLIEAVRAYQATTIPPKEALDNWRPTVNKFCSTCRWDKLSEPPCENCSISSNWEPKTP